MNAAVRCVVVDEPGEGCVLAMYEDGSESVLAHIVLGPADAVRIAADLLQVARRYYGRGAL